ncbi:hypothetical protein Sjap_007347 [Stephania japonica]|uniref:Aminotransferase class I/classII large domain-containing protein n=1 Tax=Stephania japonica TaxID=461633 RepID=A0AAP0JMI5_9MAGN
MEEHLSIASFPGMQGRTIITSSLSKTFTVTGWRVGWAIASASIASAIRNIHVKLTDSAPAPFQEAALTALDSPPDYFESLRRDYMEKRDYMVRVLIDVGFRVGFKPQGSFFILAELPENCPFSDIEFVEELIKKARVAAVPGCGFFPALTSPKESPEMHRNYQNRYIRFAFCKSIATLNAAAQRMRKILDSRGCFKLN